MRDVGAFVIERDGQYVRKRTIRGPLGAAEIEAVVDAQYDARPRPALIAIFALPFVLIGFVWFKLLLRRRSHKFGTA